MAVRVQDGAGRATATPYYFLAMRVLARELEAFLANRRGLGYRIPEWQYEVGPWPSEVINGQGDGRLARVLVRDGKEMLGSISVYFPRWSAWADGERFCASGEERIVSADTLFAILLDRAAEQAVVSLNPPDDGR